MSRVLAQYVGLPVPPGFRWSAAEWEALKRATRSPDMDQRWTTEFLDHFLVLRRSGRRIFQARIEELGDGSRRLVDLGCEGDMATFSRSAFSDSETTGMFIGAAQGLIERYRNA
jgi:hypothetical protein